MMKFGVLSVFLAALLETSQLEASSPFDIDNLDEAELSNLWKRAEQQVEDYYKPPSKCPASEKNDRSHSQMKAMPVPYNNGRQARADVKELGKSIDRFLAAVDILENSHGLSREVSERIAKRANPRDGVNPDMLCEARRISCDKNYRYRLLDGTCNNLDHPDYGMAVTKLGRYIPSEYGDNNSSPRKSSSGEELPNVKLVSLNICEDMDKPSGKLSNMMVVFGQFLSHDITSSPTNQDVNNCCWDGKHPDCLTITIPENDPTYVYARCMEFSRTFRTCATGKREQLNQITSFLDSSNIYGPTLDESKALRNFTGGRLIEVDRRLPNDMNHTTCIRSMASFYHCALAGDNRANENTALTGVHTTWMREHNRIADRLFEMNPDCTDESIYQEAKRILNAEYQHIVYSHYLPLMFGLNDVRTYQLDASGSTEYDKTIDATAKNVFATAAMRFGHTMIPNIFNLGSTNDNFTLKDHFNNPTLLYQSSPDKLVEGLSNTKAQSVDNFMVEALTRFTLAAPGAKVGQDLAALNIQRGREHGIPGYNKWRKFIGLPILQSFDDLSKVFSDPDAPSKFKKTYKNVDDIDIWLAGISEKPVDGGLFGPTFTFILGEEFRRLMYGDRFFHSHQNQIGSFTADQLTEIRKSTFADIMCLNNEIEKLQPDVFRFPGPGNDLVKCSTSPKMDLKVFEGTCKKSPKAS